MHVHTMLLADQAYLNAIRESVLAAERVDAAVAFWGAGSEHIFDGMQGEVRLLCNLLSGGTNPAPIAALRSRANVWVRQCPVLHAKVLLTDSVAVVGSANFSTNGLHFEADEIAGWKEAGLLSRDPGVLRSTKQWFEQLWEASSSVTDDDLNQAALLWAKARHQRSMAKTRGDKALPTSAEVLDRRIHIVVWGEEASPDADRQIVEVRREQRGLRADASRLDFYEDWKSLPKNSLLIDVHRGSRGGISVGEMYRRVPHLDRTFQRKDGTTGSIQVVAPEDADRELPFRWNASLRTALKKRLAKQASRLAIGSVLPLFAVLA